MNRLEVENLNKTWESFSVNFSASVEYGKTLGIVGRSGSGKSSVLKLICGLWECSKKDFKISLDGKDISNLPPARREIGMVFQDHGLFPHLTVVQNVAYGLRFGNWHDEKRIRFSKKEALAKAKDFLSIFEMQDFCDRYPQTLSGGQSQRVSLARTLITSPKVVLFDESFSSLDLPMKKKLASDIKKMQMETGFSAVFVTHNIEEAKTLCDEITVMKKGTQIWTGNPLDFNESLLD